MRIKGMNDIRLKMPSSQARGGYMALLRGEGLTPYQGAVSFKDPEGAQKPFSPHYEQHIMPLVKEFEAKRMTALAKVRALSFKVLPFTALAFIGVIFGMNIFDLELIPAGIISVMIAGVSSLIIMSPVVKYKANVKSIIFPKIFSFFGEYIYDQKGLPSVGSLKGSGIIPGYDRQRTEDYIKGEYEGVSIEITEAHLETEHRDSKGRTSYNTVFKGMFIIFSMHKDFNGKTIIKKDGGAVGNWFGGAMGELENVQLEDPVFEKQFQVYSTDQIEARYLLTTSFMDRLLKLTAIFGNETVTGGIIPSQFQSSKSLQASFYDDKLLVMVPTQKDRFETASVYVPATFEADINGILSEMDEVFQVVEILKLNQNIGL